MPPKDPAVDEDGNIIDPVTDPTDPNPADPDADDEDSLLDSLDDPTDPNPADPDADPDADDEPISAAIDHFLKGDLDAAKAEVQKVAVQTVSQMVYGDPEVDPDDDPVDPDADPTDPDPEGVV